MTESHLNKSGLGALFAAAVADVAAHGWPAGISYAALIAGVACQLGHLWLRYLDSEAARRRLKAQHFREWETARDRLPPS